MPEIIYTRTRLIFPNSKKISVNVGTFLKFNEKSSRDSGTSELETTFGYQCNVLKAFTISNE